MEAQIHGGVRPSDIAALYFTPMYSYDKPTPAIAQFARANGVEVFVNNRRLSQQELDTLAAQ
ncbi:MAG: hypothetical protein SNJ57_10225 [Cyanobacteriota bacterium]